MLDPCRAHTHRSSTTPDRCVPRPITGSRTRPRVARLPCGIYDARHSRLSADETIWAGLPKRQACRNPLTCRIPTTDQRLLKTIGLACAGSLGLTGAPARGQQASVGGCSRRKAPSSAAAIRWHDLRRTSNPGMHRHGPAGSGGQVVARLPGINPAAVTTDVLQDVRDFAIPWLRQQVESRGRKG